MQTIGLDIGYGYTKAVTNGREISFPSVVGLAVKIRYHNDLVKTGGGYYTYGVAGGEWFVGDFAKLQSQWTTSPRSRERTGMETINVLFCAAMHRLGVSGDVSLTTGLPVKWYEDRDDLMHQLSGEHTFTVNDQEERVNVVNVAVIPQPFGAFYSAILDLDGRLANDTLAAGRVGILDIGMHTTDFALADKLRYVENASDSDTVAMARAYELIARDVAEQHRLALDVHDVDHALRNGRSVKVRGEAHDISNLADRALQAVAEDILGKAATLWGRGRRIDKILVTGGGSYEMHSFIYERYPHAVMVQEPEKANARGFYCYALRKWGR